jgi:hypothetical protein
MTLRNLISAYLYNKYVTNRLLRIFAYASRGRFALVRHIGRAISVSRAVQTDFCAARACSIL